MKYFLIEPEVAGGLGERTMCTYALRVDTAKGSPNFVIGFLISVAFWIGAGCKTAELGFREKVPKAVQAEVSAQIDHFFKGVSLNNIPLLDPRTDWNNADNWPEEFSFQGFDFKASYGTFGSDWFGGPDSRSVLKSGASFHITHAIILPTPPWRHSFDFYWSRHGYVKIKGVTWGHKEVFSLQFYPTGNLFMFTRDNPDAGYRIDVYDTSGRKIGSNYNHSRYTWRRKEITSDEFYKNLGIIWGEFFPP